MKEKIQGCLLGLAIGDAFGLLVKNKNNEEIINQDDTIKEYQRAPILQLLPKEYGNEGHLMALTLESICTQRSINISDLLRCLKGWYNTHPKDITPLTDHVLIRLEQREGWEEASEGASLDSLFKIPDGGNLARCVPVGIYYTRHLDKLIQNTILVSRITHWDERCTDAAVVLNYLISQLVQENKTILETLPNFLRDKNTTVRESVENSINSSIEKLDTSGYVLGALGIGIWALKNSDSFETGLNSVVALGGKTDLNTAIAGALLGAKFGRQFIPENWITNLEGKVRIEVLANRLFEHAINI